MASGGHNYGHNKMAATPDSCLQFSYLHVHLFSEEVGQAISELSRELSTNQIASFSHRVLK